MFTQRKAVTGEMWENTDKKNSEYGHFLRGNINRGKEIKIKSCYSTPNARNEASLTSNVSLGNVKNFRMQ